MSDEREGDGLLGAAEIRLLAERLGVRPTKQRGQNFVIDGNTVRRIVRAAELATDDVVIEVGPGLGSLTLALLPHVQRVVAVEIDAVLAAALAAHGRGASGPTCADRLEVVHGRRARRRRRCPGPTPTALVANLPYNVSVPVILHLLERFPSIRRVLVMVQLEVADRLAAPPGQQGLRRPEREGALVRRRRARRRGRPHGVLAGAQRRQRAGRPHPHLAARDDGDAARRSSPSSTPRSRSGARRCGPRSPGWAGSPARAEEALRAAGVDPSERGEQLDVAEFAAAGRAAPRA